MLPIYKVVIAEDEPLILKNIIAILEKEHPHFQVAGTATNGQEAVALVERLRPHLLLTDIRMPILDGLGVLRYIHRHELPILSVLISGFDQFHYAQQALRYGACEYLLKPINPAQLGRTLRDVEARYLAKGGNPSSFDLDLALAGGSAPIPGNAGCECLLLVHRGNFSFSAQDHPGTQPPILDQVLARLLREGERCWLSRADNIRYRYLLLSCNDAGRARAFAKDLLNAINTGEPAPPISVVYAMVAGAGQLPGISAGLLDLMRHKSILGKPLFCEVGRSAHGASFQSLFAQFSTHSEQLIRALGHADGAGTKLILRDMAHTWQASQCPTSTVLNLVRFLYMQAGKDLNLPLEAGWEETLCHAFSDAPGWAELGETLYHLFSGMSSAGKPPMSAEETMRTIDEYICTHYAERITNQTLAKQYGFVPSYISKLFKEYKGLSPCEYVTQVRIDRAKSMIALSTDIHVGNIAATVGFSDASYFSRLFKQQTGLLPTEYREHILNGQG